VATDQVARFKAVALPWVWAEAVPHRRRLREHPYARLASLRRRENTVSAITRRLYKVAINLIGLAGVAVYCGHSTSGTNTRGRFPVVRIQLWGASIPSMSMALSFGRPATKITGERRFNIPPPWSLRLVFLCLGFTKRNLGNPRCDRPGRHHATVTRTLHTTIRKLISLAEMMDWIPGPST
jgi:hypothetical protein